MSPPIAGKHIIIAGAGLSGLAFAHSVEKFWPPQYPKPTITIYERGPKQVDADREGYSLSIRSEDTTAGLQILQKLGLLDYFLSNSLPGVHEGKAALIFRDAQWKTFGAIMPPNPPPDGLPVAQMRVMRPILRQHLIDTLPTSVTVHWETASTSARQSKDGGMQLVMEESSTVDGDLLIVADGANSKIRSQLLPSEQLSFAGVVAVLGTSRFPDGVPPELHGTWGPLFGGGSGTGLFVFDIDHKSAFWQISYRADKPRTDILRRPETVGKGASILEEARQRGRAFAQPFGKLLDATDLETLTVLNGRDKSAIDHEQLKGMPVVFVGDSNHAMTPFSGSGANLALMDGMDLAKLLSDPAQNFDTAVAEFDKMCKKRSEQALSAARLTIRVLHSTGWTLWFYTLAMRVVFFFGRLLGTA